MAAKKIYAVKRGKETGIFLNWADCRASVEGYPGAEYKGFTDREEAEAYLREGGASSCPGETPPEGTLLAYVDGSYEDSRKRYAFGCVFLLPDGRIYTQRGGGDNPQSLQHRNVTGEMLGAMYAVKAAMYSGYEAVELRYDYQGIEKWVTGEWRSKTELTRKYAESMREWGRSIRIRFTKVAAHTNVKYNELADQTAKSGLEEGIDIPKVCGIEDMTEWNPCD
ncbi:MAG: ribonuclease H family protein [Roseburia sp.]|nr:ribonuclease H family protein [Roseburia sp.]MCM1096459.1 ribonuclease H family protein [Ruminococcus flavefaciens]